MLLSSKGAAHLPQGVFINMSTKLLPFSKNTIDDLIKVHGSPFHLYDEAGIRAVARRLNKAFAWAEGFKEFFAVKATPNPHLLSILKEEGLGADCSSLPELLLAECSGMQGDDIMFSSNDTPVEDFQKACDLNGIINLDDLSHIEFLNKHCGMPELICFRYNPGPLREGNVIIGSPEEAKFGCTRENLFEGFRRVRELGCKRFGLHTMVASNELDPAYFVETARMLFALAQELAEKLDVRLDFVNLGGGIGIPYRPEQAGVDLEQLAEGVREAYETEIRAKGLHPLKIYMENGRVVTGPNGYLVSKVRHVKKIYKDYVGLDASMADLMRPGMYGAYHHITVLGKETTPADCKYDVTGSLCENNDKFAIDRPLPSIEVGDVVVLHDTGAHGHAMGFNYNGKLRHAELLMKEDGSVVPIRRAETIADYFATLDYPGLPN